jgi:diadenosine tetraphosphate (Ap4A) HIT family hydrolase
MHDAAHHPTDFVLDPQLAAESHWLLEWPLCMVRLFDDQRYAWLLLIPRKPHLVEMIDLDEASRQQLMRELSWASHALRQAGKAGDRGALGCDKLNIATLGNVVRQLHFHVIARYKGDPAGPRPVWGVGTREPYEAPLLPSHLADWRQRLSSRA